MTPFGDRICCHLSMLRCCSRCAALGPCWDLGVTPAASGGHPCSQAGAVEAWAGTKEGSPPPTAQSRASPGAEGLLLPQFVLGELGMEWLYRQTFCCCGQAAHPPVVTLTAVLYCDSVSLSAQGGTLSVSHTHPTAQQHLHFGFKHYIFSGFPLRVGPAGVSPGFPCAGLSSRAELGGTLPSKLPYPGSCHAPVLHCGTVLQNPLLQ